MEKNTDILIEAAANGFIVRPEPDYRDNGYASSNSMLVFQSFAELQRFLSEHFEHRAIEVLRDIE